MIIILYHKILSNYLMSFDGKKIHLPKSKKDYPNKKFLKKDIEKNFNNEKFI